MRKAVLTSVGGVTAAFLASLCCVGPLLFVTLGVGAGLASAFEPLRPVFGVLMLALLAAGFWAVYGRRVAAPLGALGDDARAADADPRRGSPVACASPLRRGRDVVVLWSATVLALVLWSFPTWSLWLL